MHGIKDIRQLHSDIDAQLTAQFSHIVLYLFQGALCVLHVTDQHHIKDSIQNGLGNIQNIDVFFCKFLCYAGNNTDAVGTNDIWTFTRDIRSADPNWKLSETDEAA